ncbi:MAG: hypothetical protein E5W43_21675, partial [Mesorhizobium sp.]
ASILLHNYYGWFARAERGIYALTELGQAALLSQGVLEGPLQVAPFQVEQLGAKLGA